MFFDEKHVMIHGCFIVWEGVTRPDTVESGKNAGHPKYNLKVVIPPNCPDVADLEQLAQTTLQASEFRGVLPTGGYMPLGKADATEFNGLFPGWAVVSAKTNMLPDVYDENGQKLDPMQYNPMLYSGQKVDLLVHCYAYNQKSKGVAAGLDGFKIIASAQAAPLQLGGDRPDTQAAFNGRGPQPAPAAPAAGGFDPVTGQPIAPAPAAPAAGGFDPVTGQPLAPQQSTGYLPPRQ